MPIKKKKSGPVAKKENKLQVFYDSIDFRTWWEEFSTDCNKNGTLKYKTIWQFIQAKTKVAWQQNFLWWILGPEGTSEEYKAFDQLDFEKRREAGHWYSSKNIDTLQKEVASKTNALAVMKSLGNINLEIIGSYTELKRQIDREYAGQIFLPSLSAKENALRAEQYMKLQSQLMELQIQAQTLLAKTQGLDINRLSEFFSLFGRGIAETANLANAGLIDVTPQTIEGQAQDPASQALSDIMSMVSLKMKSRELDAPDPDINRIIVNAAEKQRPALVPKKG